MKKIIMAVAAIAMAASMFAADVSAGTKINTSLLRFQNYEVDNIEPGFYMFKAQNGSEDYANPNFAFAISDDRAGGELKITTKGGGVAPELTTQKIWFKPLDMLKITVGNVGGNLNQETIGWCNTESGYEGYGFALNLDVSGFGVEAALAPEQKNYWFSLPKDGKAALAKMYLKAGYSADFGTINGMFKLNATGSNQDAMMFGVGYKGSFAPVNTLFVNALGYMNGDFAGIRGEVFADVGLDGGIGIKAFVPVTFVMKGDKMFATDDNKWHVGAIGYWPPVKDNQLILGTLLRVSFPVGSMGGYVEIKDNNWLAEDFELIIKPDLSGRVGVMGWDAAVEVTLHAPKGGEFGIKIDVPVSFSVNF